MKMTDDVEAVMGGVRMGVNVDIKRTDGECSAKLAMMILCSGRIFDAQLLNDRIVQILQ